MRFGTIQIDDAEGCLLVHSLRFSSGRLPKGKVITAEDIVALFEDGISEVTAIRLDPDDILEDDAAAAIASAFHADNTRRSEAATGRVNIHAAVNGLFTVDRDRIDALNRVDPAITIATLADRVAVTAGDMVATIKIIPLAVPAATVEAAAELVRDAAPFGVTSFLPHRVTLIATELPTLKTSVMDKTARLLRHRLAPSRSTVEREIRVPHNPAQLAEALRVAISAAPDQHPLIIVFGASAVADAEDVIPAAIRAAGGTVEHIGMPVDPGNLLVLGRIGEVSVLGAPGCARSPRENGFDWVLHRILIGKRPTAFDLTGMGVGGLLKEIPDRPRPRETATKPAQPVTVGAILLAAGQASRMGRGSPHKLLAAFDGVPLVRRSAQTLIAAEVTPVVAITGHRHAEIEAALDGLDLTTELNPDYSSGMASSLVHGFSIPMLAGCDGLLVMLADMPAVTAAHLRELVQAFRNVAGQAVVRAVHRGKRGNPIILPRAAFDAVLRLQGDVGARAIVETCGLPIIDVEIGPAAHLDVDTPEAVVGAGGLLKD